MGEVVIELVEVCVPCSTCFLASFEVVFAMRPSAFLVFGAGAVPLRRGRGDLIGVRCRCIEGSSIRPSSEQFEAVVDSHRH